MSNNKMLITDVIDKIVKLAMESEDLEIILSSTAALKTLNMALYNIKKKRYIKNKLSCTSGYGCKFYGTEHCP